MNLLKKATFNMQGKQLILKNLANPTRIKVLLEMFPNAKVVEIHRNPYIIYPSMLTFYQKAIKFFILKDISYKEINKNILKIYKNMMNTYFKQRKLIPEENLVEIKFEEFERHPLKKMKEVYKKFHIKGFEENKSRFKTYLESIEDYKKNKYKLNPKTISRIDDYWEEIIIKLQYHVPKEVL